MTAIRPKIFGIGLSKTGTTSLAHALEMLGYKTKDYPGITRYRAGDLSSVDLNMVDAYDALTDTPIPSFYRELDQRYPGSKFILTVREPEAWLTSCKKQFNEKLAAKQNEAHNMLFLDLYGCTTFDEQRFREGYEKFVRDVHEYFKDRPDDLLRLDVTAGEGWEKLCPFLGRATPDLPFPKANVTQISWMNVSDVVSIARDAGHVTLKAYHRKNSASPYQRALIALRGGDAAAMGRATREAHRRIIDGLRKLNPQIPVLSALIGAPPLHDRAKWNHLWLVDPLDGTNAFLGASGHFTVNIALIQDGVPIFGVVYAPVTDTAYYARFGQGAFVARGSETPRQLTAASPSARAIDAIRTSLAPPPSTGDSLALRMCLVAEEPMESCTCNETSAEWQTAAAQLVAATAGKRVYDCDGGQAIRYNTERLTHGCISIEPGGRAIQ